MCCGPKCPPRHCAWRAGAFMLSPHFVRGDMARARTDYSHVDPKRTFVPARRQQMRVSQKVVVAKHILH